ncbi:MAG: amino acid permease [bacterium]|nr:amino acid permease [bacterium]
MSNNLKRTLNLKDAISIVAGSMIGSGIFIVSAEISRQTNSVILLLLCWILAGITTLCGALCYGELSSTIPDEGGQYVFLKKIYNEKLAFIYGWTLFTVIQTGTLAAVNIAFAKFIGLIFPVISESTTVLSIGDYHLSLQRIFAAATVIILTYINSRGVKQGMFTQHLFTLTKVFSMLLIIGLGLFVGFNFDCLRANLSLANNVIPHGFEFFKVLSVAIVGSMFASITWNNVTFIASEIKKPQRNIPLALLFGSIAVIALYFGINMIYIGTMPLETIQNSHQDIRLLKRNDYDRLKSLL